MNLIVEIRKDSLNVELNFYYGVTSEKAYEIVNKHKALWAAGRYKSLDHIVDFSGSEPDRLVIELLPEVAEKCDSWDWARDEIDRQYEYVLNKLKGGSFLGVPMDATDMKWMVASAYHLGQHEIRVQHMDERALRGHQHMQEGER